LFIGVKAEACFKRHVSLQIGNGSIDYARPPSTSPANALVSFESKLEAWKMIMLHRADPVGLGSKSRQ
jgi:G:T/U-mismatch repair DNA glycosylase